MTKKNSKSRSFYLFLITLIALSSCKKDVTALISGSESRNALSFSQTTLNSLNASSSATGSISRDEWDNVTGNDVVNIPLQTTPTKSNLATSLEGPVSYASNYGVRLRGYIYPPADGDYTFWEAGDDAVELWLSTDETVANKVKIASTLSWTNYREWNKFASQQSAKITMQAGHKYYIEVLQKQGGGGDNLSIQWMLPGNVMETPIPGLRLSPYVASATAYTQSSVINLDGIHDITISGKSIIGGSMPAITLTNCYNVHITKSKLYNSTGVGIYLYNCKNITIDYNYFTNVSSGVYAERTTSGGIIVDNNQFLNMAGPFPRGQFVQFNNVSGPLNSISFNKGENIFGQSYPEDAISLYESNGTSNSPIKIVGNWIRGGGPSSSGGGIMLGDNGGSYQTATDNILVNPGEYGMAVVGGDHNVIVNNLIYGMQQYFTNVGLYTNTINGHTITNSTITNNKVCYYNSTNYQNNAWLSPNTNKPEGWDANLWGANIDASLLPKVIITSN